MDVVQTLCYPSTGPGGVFNSIGADGWLSCLWCGALGDFIVLGDIHLSVIGKAFPNVS